ncbi:MAG: efflux RND transporter periplasmic adaptor subunit [Rhodospirillaceae bacterium]|nr:efflux RND transporter periplasmic adaptor subunit [Rhodospirillaceae bacterium]MDD9926891.1 efflux RND transporter periplasmic adaptor subunit [Rhodospirillaceae bacterium]
MHGILSNGVMKTLVLAAASLGLAACPGDTPQQQAQAPQAPQVSVAKPIVKDIKEWDDFTGRFQAVEDVDIRARVTGYVKAVHFDEGELVKEGTLLVTIDQRVYRAALEEARAALKVAEAALQYATQELKRAENLSKRGNISRSVVDQRREAFAAARAEIEGAKAAVQRARLDMEFTQIRAPIAGRISAKQISIGSLVSANETILTNIASVNPIHFVFDVDERSYLAYARMAQEGKRKSGRETPYEVVVSLSDEKEATRVGFLDFVDNRIDQESGTIRGRAVFPNDDLLLLPGLFGRISVPGSPVYKGVLIPDEAIASDQDRRIVYALGEGNKVTAKVIRPGPQIDGYRVVRRGLTGDETLIVNGLMRVRPGVTVNPQVTELPLARKRR